MIFPFQHYKLKLFFISILFLVSCSKNNLDNITVPIVSTDAGVDRTIGEPSKPFQVLGKSTLEKGLANGTIFSPQSSEGLAYLKAAQGNSSVTVSETPLEEGIINHDRTKSLTLGFPRGLLGEEQIFGGVITSVSDKENESLGTLKLTDLTPVHVRTVLVNPKINEFAFGLVGCSENCSEDSEKKVLYSIPIVGVDTVKDLILLDIGAFGDGLNLIKMIDPDGAYTKLKTKSSETVLMDYSVSTLIFDVLVTMVPIAPPPTPVADTQFTIRWYLKMNSGFHSEFKPRTATEGVGFFMTERVTDSKIQRHRLPTQGSGALNEVPIKYYIKDVPKEYKAPFAAAFDEWNQSFISVTGKKLLSYEFIDAGDTRSELLVAGDIRYNILEWDLKNKAGYGGLGPSIANQYTGEILSSNVLIQGPTIIRIYTTWFKVGKQAEELRERGLFAEADELIREAAVEIRNDLESSSQIKFSLSLGRNLEFKINSQIPPLEDPVIQREDFDEVPTGYTFETYMPGYFRDMVGHELGHNLGLRHNFRGNLYSSETPLQGKVSISIMEYLGRRFRYLDAVGAYDLMAVQYGYLGIPPTRKDIFCTDENVPTKDSLSSSAECSRDDATPDPFGYLEKRLSKGTSLLLGRGIAEAPVWNVDQMKRELTATIPALGMYAATAEKTASKWTHFFIGGDRPKTANVEEVKKYVYSKLKAEVCPVDLPEILKDKSEEAKAKTLSNLEDLRKKVTELLTPLKIAVAEELKCL